MNHDYRNLDPISLKAGPGPNQVFGNFVQSVVWLGLCDECFESILTTIPKITPFLKGLGEDNHSLLFSILVLKHRGKWDRLDLEDIAKVRGFEP